jgi:hypothetical protein
MGRQPQHVSYLSENAINHVLQDWSSNCELDVVNPDGRSSRLCAPGDGGAAAMTGPMADDDDDLSSAFSQLAAARSQRAAQSGPGAVGKAPQYTTTHKTDATSVARRRVPESDRRVRLG